MQIRLLVLNFRTPYHVGWKVPEPIIESITVHRALVYTSTIIEGSDKRIQEIIDLRTSAVLPVVKHENCYKLLIPLPPIPSKIPLKKRALKYTTLKAAVKLLRLARTKTLFIEEVKETTMIGYKDVDKADSGVILFEGGEKLCYRNEVIHECEENVNPPKRIVEKVDVYVNRIDRATNSADVYKISGFKPNTKLGVILHGDKEIVEYATGLFSVIEELGIGGMRTRGFGKFVIEQGYLCDQEYIKTTCSHEYIVLLGSYTYVNGINIEESYINKKSIMGYAGPAQDSYLLPYLDFIGSGSIIYIDKDGILPKHYVIKTSYVGALMIFNPVIAGDTS